MKKITPKGFIEVLKNSFKGFSEHKVSKLSGSLAYSTVFSLGPLLVVIIALCSMFWGREAIEGSIYGQLQSLVGKDTALQLQQIIRNVSLQGKTDLAVIVGVITLLIGSTAIFAEIQDSINFIWGIRPMPKKGWLILLRNRFLSFSVIVSLGFLLLVSLSISAIIDGFSNKLKAHFPDAAVLLFYIVNLLLTLILTSLIFAVIFKVLPDAKIRLKDVLFGAILTALLFMAGKFVISFYISKASIGTTYGAVGSLVIILLWVYYSSMILYFGAEFTKAYALKYGTKIYPDRYAVTIEKIENEKPDEPVKG